MEPSSNDYHFSFFKPSTDSARRNRNMVVELILIWTVAIFGFQILLKVIEKPTPEPAFIIYESGWDAVLAGDMEISNLQNVSQSALSVLGKVAIEPAYRQVLDNAVSWMAYNIADTAQKERLLVVLKEFENIAAVTTDVSDPAYVEARNNLIPICQEIFNLQQNDVRGKIAAFEVKSSLMGSFNADNKRVFEEAMKLYLIHNQSFLTDTKFLGFPFHYFYTGVFLLVLFVGLCWLYCVRTDMFNKKYSIED